MRRVERPPWSVSQGCLCHRTSRRTYLWVPCLATRSVDLRSFDIRQRPDLDARPILLIATLFLSPALSKAQLTTGFVEGTVRDTSSQTARQAAILIKGSAGFSSLVHTSSAGQFTLSLPYGRYLLWNGSSEQSKQTAF